MKLKILVLFAAVTTVLSACGEGIHFVDSLKTVEPTSIVEEVQQEPVPAEKPVVECTYELPSEEESLESTEQNSIVDSQAVSSEGAAVIEEAPVIVATPEPTSAPVTSTPEQVKAPAPAAMSYGSIPFSLSEFQYDWWSIDGSDDAYWACANNINAMRRAAGLSDLAVDSGLSSIANSRCEQIVASGDFSHNGMYTAGEILGENYNSASSVCGAWQASSSHYAQIIGGYSSMGIGCVFEQGGQTVWCVVFS